MTIPITSSAASAISTAAPEMTAVKLDRAGLLRAGANTRISRFAVFIPADELGVLRPIVVGDGAVVGAFAVVHGGTAIGEQGCSSTSSLNTRRVDGPAMAASGIRAGVGCGPTKHRATSGENPNRGADTADLPRHCDVRDGAARYPRPCAHKPLVE
ncbi:hypothetical protein [Nocardia nepalensis]|uniref:hypothetical protein n=1 Tax=Nocardia nepalensis TaxID=3375448 RepID=UPI003B682F22